MSDVTIVVDPNYAERIRDAAQHAPVWVVDTPGNRRVCELLWNTNKRADHRQVGAITTFKTQIPKDRRASVVGILDQVELHHGDVISDTVAFPRGFVLEVIGVELTDDLTRALRGFGFQSFVSTTEGFQATI